MKTLNLKSIQETKAVADFIVQAVVPQPPVLYDDITQKEAFGLLEPLFFVGDNFNANFNKIILKGNKVIKISVEDVPVIVPVMVEQNNEQNISIFEHPIFNDKDKYGANPILLVGLKDGNIAEYTSTTFKKLQSKEDYCNHYAEQGGMQEIIFAEGDVPPIAFRQFVANVFTAKQNENVNVDDIYIILNDDF